MKIEENYTSNNVDLLVYSDSDWAGHKGSRKSASSCFVKDAAHRGRKGSLHSPQEKPNVMLQLAAVVMASICKGAWNFAVAWK